MNKKQLFLILTSIFMVMILSSLTVFANSSIKVSVDNKILSFDSEPFIESGATLVPMRKIFEALNADVVWDSASQTVIINSSQDKGNKQVVFNDYVPYSTSDLATLARNILNGDVVYFDGQYWATPQFANIIANEEVVYENDVSTGTNIERNNILTPEVELIIIETPENETSIDGILPSEESEEQKAIDDKVEQFRTEWVGENELKNSYKVTTTQLHNAIWFHRYENSENVTLYTINNPPASLESEKVYKKDGVEFQYIKDSEISKRYGQGLYFKRSDLKREGVIK